MATSPPEPTVILLFRMMAVPVFCSIEMALPYFVFTLTVLPSMRTPVLLVSNQMPLPPLSWM